MDQLSDARLIELAKAGDQSAFAALFSRYFDSVYDFAARMLRDRDDTAAAVRETFFRAMTSLGGLHEGVGFRGWTFAIARNTVLHRLENTARPRPPAFFAEGEHAGFEATDPARVPAESAAAALVWEAAAGLDPRQLSLLDFHLRQGLDSDEIAGGLHVTTRNAGVMLHRLEEAVEDSIGDALLLRDDRHHCDGLDAALGPASPRAMSPEARRLVEHHVATCPDCAARRTALAPLAVFAALVPVAPPPGAREQMLETLLPDWPGPASSSGGAAGVAAVASTGGPDHRGRAGMFGRARVLVPVLGSFAVILVAALLLPQSPLSLVKDDGGDHGVSPDATAPGPAASPSVTAASTPTTAPTPTPTSSPTAAGAAPAPTATAAAGGPTPTPSPTRSPTSVVTNTPTPTPTPTPTSAPPSPTPTATATACVAQLSALPGAINIPPGNISGFNVVNGTGCVTTFSVATDQPWLAAAGGDSLGFGESHVSVAVISSRVPAAPGTYIGHVEVSWGGGSLSVTVSTTRAP